MGYFTRISRGIVICLLWLATDSLQAQENTDTAVFIAAKGEDLRFSLAWTNANHGIIQWQVFTGNDSWADIPSAITKNLKIKADTDAWFRAKVSSGTCDPVYSPVTSLNVIDVLTLKTDSITDTRGVVFCSVDTTGGKISETGVLLDTKAIPDSTSTRIPDATGNDT